MTTSKPLKPYPEKFFETQAEFEKWMEKNFDKEDGVWLIFYKKATGKPSLNYDLALEVALMFGWIDGISNRIDEEKYKQKFTPRRSKSIWSKINRDHIERLTNLGRMRPSGFAQVAAAKEDGRWDAAYDSPSTSKPPKEFLVELEKNKKALEFYKTLNKTNTYAITWRLQTAKKPETVTKRIREIIEMLERGEKYH